MALALCHYQSPEPRKSEPTRSIDLSRFVDVDTAAQLMNISSGHLRRRCPDLWKRGLAVKATPPGSGKERWLSAETMTLDCVMAAKADDIEVAFIEST